MPSAPTVSERPARARARQEPLDLFAIALAAVLPLLIALSGVLADHSRVDITFENPTAFAYDVSVQSTGSEQVLDLGTLTPASTRTFGAVADRGESWSISFRYAGVDAGSIDVTRTDIERGAVTVPTQMAQVLEQEGIAPPPP